MSSYVKAVDYSAKDALASGNPNKIIKGTELNDEFNAIATAVGTKADLASPTFLGNPSATTQPLGNNSTRIATTAFVQNELTDLEANVNITGGNIAGVAISGGTISSLTSPLAVNSGGTGAATLADNAVLIGNGTDAIQTIAPGTSGNVLKSNGSIWESAILPSLGVGQTYTNVTGSRAFNTEYTNDTDKPILVIINIEQANVGNSGVFFIDSKGVYQLGIAGGSDWNFTAVIPVGVTYKFENTFGISAILSWWELR